MIDRYSVAYNLVITLAFIAHLPRFLYEYFVHSKYKNSLPFRLGLKMPNIQKKKGEKILWVHAVSLGETKSCSQLVQEIQKKHPEFTLILSTVTETGHEEAKKIVGEERAFYLPLDFSWTMKKLMDQIRPDLLVLVETDFWFHLFHYAKEIGAKILLVSGKISKKSTKLYALFPKFSHKLFSYIDLFCLQNNAYQKRFQTIGVDPSRIQVTGNLKYDQNMPLLPSKEIKEWREKMGIYEGDRVITIASTHAPEEKWLLEQMQKVWQVESNLKILLAPRHPERFFSVANLLRNENIPFITLSKIHHKTSTERVILIDSMGFLPICYQLSELAIIGGSFQEKVGGHNVLEPNFYQTPVFFGPYMNTQVELRKMVLSAKSGKEVPLPEIAVEVEEFLNDNSQKDSMSQSAKTLVESLKGRKKETYDAIKSFL